LAHLQNCRQLQELDISGSDIDSGLHYLPTDELIFFLCSNNGRKEAGVNKIKQLLKWGEKTAMNTDVDFNLAKVDDIINYQKTLVSQIVQHQ
jgi:hypothetical protein